jgi:transcriptional regulator with XRE-family HTH domain
LKPGPNGPGFFFSQIIWIAPLPARIRCLLAPEEPGLTQEDLADRAGIHRTYLSDVERGSRNICLLNIERVAAALSLPLSELFRLVERP